VSDIGLYLSVLDPIAVIYAVATGLAFGATAILYISLRYPPKVPMSTRLVATVVALASMTAGTLFFAGQVVEAYASGDQFWPRALARGTLWELFSLSIGVGLAIARSFAHRA